MEGMVDLTECLDKYVDNVLYSRFNQIITLFSKEIVRKYDADINVLDNIIKDLNFKDVNLIDASDCLYVPASTSKTSGVRCQQTIKKGTLYCLKHQKYTEMDK